MKYDLENHLPYALLAIFVLAVFYGIYFAKMLAQKRRGIQTQLLPIVFGWSCLPANARFTGFLENEKIYCNSFCGSERTSFRLWCNGVRDVSLRCYNENTSMT